MTAVEFQDALDRCGGRQEPLPRKLRWERLQEWREVYAAGLHAARGRWSLGRFEWHVFSFGFARALVGERAARTYAGQSPEAVVICPQAGRLPAVRLVGGALPEFRRGVEDIYVWPDDLSWTMAFTHEEDSGLGPYFSRREWIDQAPDPAPPPQCTSGDLA